jgi:hypothetical protein
MARDNITVCIGSVNWVKAGKLIQKTKIYTIEKAKGRKR